MYYEIQMEATKTTSLNNPYQFDSLTVELVQCLCRFAVFGQEDVTFLPTFVVLRVFLVKDSVTNPSEVIVLFRYPFLFERC